MLGWLAALTVSHSLLQDVGDSGSVVDDSALPIAGLILHTIFVIDTATKSHLVEPNAILGAANKEVCSQKRSTNRNGQSLSGRGDSRNVLAEQSNCPVETLVGA